jgi:hypothetical protein
MQLTINNKSRISEIQKKFSEIFPYLKIEFYKIPHKEGMGTPEKYRWTEDKQMNEIRTELNEGIVNLLPGLTPTVFERLLREKFDLYVQVLRKSEKEWIETTSTDDWTLLKLNQLAMSESDLSKQ